jgi:uncharacterized protein (DUF302 family)
MHEQLRSILYGPHAPAPASQRVLWSSLPFEATLARLRDGLQAADLWLIQEIDPQKLAARDGWAILPTRQLLFFHPRYLTRLLEADPNAIMEVPLKVVVMQLPEGQVIVRHPDLESVFSSYPKLRSLGAELAGLVSSLVGGLSAANEG